MSYIPKRRPIAGLGEASFEAYCAGRPPGASPEAICAGYAGSTGAGAKSNSGITDTIAKIGGAFFGALKSDAKSSGASAAYQQALMSQQGSGTPAWLLPVAIGGIGLLAIVMLKRK